MRGDSYRWGRGSRPSTVSVIVELRNSTEIASTLRELYQCLTLNAIPHEIIVVNDRFDDETVGVLEELSLRLPTLRYVDSAPGTRGQAVARGLEEYRGETVAIYDNGADTSRDLVRSYRRMHPES